MGAVKKILASIFCAVIILIVTWKYQNYDYTLVLEDSFFKKIFFVKDKLYSPPPKVKASLVFINTGKDLALAEDTIEYGNVAISDREKIYRFLHFINSVKQRPAFTVLDIQFYYPFTPDIRIDSMMQAEIKRNPDIILPLVKNSEGRYWKPLYDAQYGYSDYRTFSATFNKFRIMNQENIRSIPILLHEKVNGVRYSDHFFYPTCNDSLCLSAIWPSYFIKDEDLVKSTAVDDMQSIQVKNVARPGKEQLSLQYYNMGELLFDIEASPENYASAFNNKIVIVGNFNEDVHVTPVGKMTGPVLLANIYLSLLNRQHVMNKWLIVILLVSMSALSYIALFKNMPEVKFKFKFLFSSYLSNFLKTYISYLGAMLLLSLITLIFFNVQMALFLPSLMFSGIEYIKNKKYKELTS